VQTIIKIKNYLSDYLQDVLMTSIIIIFTYLLICHPESTTRGISIGIGYCVNLLVPSLFPFMFLSRFAAILEPLNFIKKPIDSITKVLFYLPGSAAPVIILSLIGGYPVGASGAEALFQKKEINSEQLNRLMCFTVNAGPAFMINVVGYSLLKNPFLGAILLAIQVVISLGLGIVLGIIARFKQKPFYIKPIEKKARFSPSEALVEAAVQTSYAVIMMCSLILVFTLIISTIQVSGIFDYISNLQKILKIPSESLVCMMISCLEITSGCSFAANHFISVPLIAFMISYGGICTHFQIASILKKTNLNYFKFHLFRVLNACFCFGAIYLILNVFEFSTPAFISTISSSSPSSGAGALGSIALIAFCIYFTLSIKN